MSNKRANQDHDTDTDSEKEKQRNSEMFIVSEPKEIWYHKNRYGRCSRKNRKKQKHSKPKNNNQINEKRKKFEREKHQEEEEVYDFSNHWDHLLVDDNNSSNNNNVNTNNNHNNNINGNNNNNETEVVSVEETIECNEAIRTDYVEEYAFLEKMHKEQQDFERTNCVRVIPKEICSSNEHINDNNNNDTEFLAVEATTTDCTNVISKTLLRKEQKIEIKKLKKEKRELKILKKEKKRELKTLKKEKKREKKKVRKDERRKKKIEEQNKNSYNNDSNEGEEFKLDSDNNNGNIDKLCLEENKTKQKMIKTSLQEESVVEAYSSLIVEVKEVEEDKQLGKKTRIQNGAASSLNKEMSKGKKAASLLTKNNMELEDNVKAITKYKSKGLKKKAILTSPFMPITSRQASHRGAQAVIYADMLRQSGVDIDIDWSGTVFNNQNISQYESMYVYHGNDWKGTLNLFGGVQKFSNISKLLNFSMFRGKVYSLDIPFPNYHNMLDLRLQRAKEKKSIIQPEWLSVDMNNLSQMQKNAILIPHPGLRSDTLVVGDSHAICMYRPGCMMSSTPFMSLYGAIKQGLTKFINKAGPVRHFTTVEFYFGNIDIRHHLCCQLDNDDRDHVQKTKDLANAYIVAVEALPVADVAIYELLPIEDVSRKIPKSGYHKGKPYWGTWEERNECRLVFRKELEEKAKRVRIIPWVDRYMNEEGKLDFEHMEKPKSVHLSRASYPYWTGVEKERA